MIKALLASKQVAQIREAQRATRRDAVERNADIEIGHRSTTCSLLANISLKLGRRLEWEGDNERFVNCDEANELLHYEYRAPWSIG